MSWTPHEGDEYLDADEVEAHCREMAAAHPEWVALDEVGESGQGRPLLLLTVGRQPDAEDDIVARGERPALWIDGGTHAPEWAGVSAVLFVVGRWVERLAGGDDDLQRWFSDHEVLAMPCISPDGMQAMHEGASFIRSSLREGPEGRVREGLDPCDMSGDGRVRMMRWRHPAGSFVEDESWAPFLRPRTLDDDPEDAYFICTEGEFVNWNGVEWTRADLEHGVDLNRNYPGSWSPFQMFGMDSGAYTLSEPESRAVTDTFGDHPHIGCALTMHTYTGTVLTQPYREQTPLGEGDLNLMEGLADDLADGLNYDVRRVHPDFMYDEDEPIGGVWADTISTVFGVPGYTVELWDPFDYVGVELETAMDFFLDPDLDKAREVLTAYAEREGAMSPWQSIQHPQLGEVEVGGLEYLRTIRNPPLEALGEECEKAWTMAERARHALPEVEASVQIEPVGRDARRVRLILENTGFLPTSGLTHGEEVQATPAMSAALCTDDGARADGPSERRLDHLSGWGQLRSGPAKQPLYAGLPAEGHRAFAEWTVHGHGELTLSWQAGRAGTGTRTIQIEKDSPESP